MFKNKQLPKDISSKILSYLSVTEFQKAQLVCKDWNAVINDADINLEKGITVRKKRIKSLCRSQSASRGWDAISGKDKSAWAYGHRMYVLIAVSLLVIGIIEIQQFFSNRKPGNILKPALYNLLPALLCFVAVVYLSEPSNMDKVSDFFAKKRETQNNKEIKELTSDIARLEIKHKMT